MTHGESLTIYKSQTKNVYRLNSARRQVNRVINSFIRKGDEDNIKTFTHIYALIYSTWVEANFLKLIHTPYGFPLNEIVQIKNEQKDSIEKGWNKCLELAIKRVSKWDKNSDLPNRKQKINEYINEYIIKQSLIRNKIAHGQWEIAFNKYNTFVNNDTTLKIAGLDVIEIAKYFKVYEYILNIIEILIESPNKSFHRDYWLILTELEEYIRNTANYNFNSKKMKLQQKQSRRKI